MRVPVVGGIVFGVLLLVAAPVEAARPLDTEDTGTVEPGAVQLELSGTFARGDSIDAWLVLAKLATGVVPRLEASVQASFLALDFPDGHGEAGLSDTFVRVKYRLLDETPSLPALLGTVELRLPTGDAERGLGLDDVDVAPLAVASKTLGPVTVFANAGYRFTLRDRDFDAWLLSAAIEYPVARALSVVAELVSDLATTSARDDIVLVRTGLVYGLTDRLKLDGAVAFGLTRRTPDVIVTVGITAALFR
jgi:Putative MetA-pathway of phenol degradation